MALILIGGGVRSGKSSYALTRARACGSRLVYIATAQALDEEMSQRIQRHRAERDAAFITIEEPLDLASALRRTEADAIVIDCLTLWLSNLMHHDRSIEDAAEAAVCAASGHAAPVFAVTNEVGCGIVPVTFSGREFRDQSGIVNQRFAAAAAEVYFMIFGQPLRLK